MRSYYESFNKIIELNDFDRNDLTPYIWQQKAEICALHNTGPEFWIVLDYLIHLTSDLLKHPKDKAEKAIQTILRPLYEKHNPQIQSLYRKIPEQEFYYLKQELKTIHHIISHTINLIDKGMPHFIPSYLFVSSIENMKLLYPQNEKAYNPAMLTRRNYPVLLARHIASNFSRVVVEFIDFLLWYREISPVLLTEDRIKLHQEAVEKKDVLMEEKYLYNTAEQYSLQHLIIELREVITSSLIAEKLSEIIEDIAKLPEGAPLDATRYLMEISSIFIPNSTEMNKNNTIVRDLSIITIILNNILIAIESGDKEKLFSQIYLSKSLSGFLGNVTKYLLSPAVALELNTFIELMRFFDFSYPTIYLTPEINNTIRKLRKIMMDELERIKSKEDITILNDDILLFVDKVSKLRAKED